MKDKKEAYIINELPSGETFLSVKISDLLSDESLDGKLVCVTGWAHEVKIKISKKGNPYTTFKLLEEGGIGQVDVFAWGHCEIPDGLKIYVLGRFFREKKKGGYIWENTIEAELIEGWDVIQ